MRKRRAADAALTRTHPGSGPHLDRKNIISAFRDGFGYRRARYVLAAAHDFAVGKFVHQISGEREKACQFCSKVTGLAQLSAKLACVRSNRSVA